MSHPSLDGYAIDEDYLNVDNRDAESSVARDSIVDDTSSDGSNTSAEVVRPVDDSQDSDTEQVCESCESQKRDTLPSREYEDDTSHLLYQGRSSFSTREQNMKLNVISPTSNDGRSVTRTYWQPRDVPDAKKEQYSRLLQWQEGQWTSERDAQNKQADTRRVIDTFGSKLDCTSHQIDTVTSIIEGANLKHMGPYSYQHSVLAAYAIATFITDERDVKGTPEYRRLVDSIGSDAKEMRNVRKLLRDKSNYFE